MKKSIAILLSLFVFASSVFAQSTASALPEEKVDISVKTIVPENQHLHPEDKTGKIRIEYIPMSNEARIYYTCMYVTYDEGRAMNSVLGVLEDFTKEHQYYRYIYMEQDKEKFYKDSRGISWAQRYSHVRFVR